MATRQHTFRLEEKTIKDMDRLITNPPSMILDGKLGAARNRTELVEVLVKRALEAQKEEQAKAKISA